jgi:MFS family permease
MAITKRVQWWLRKRFLPFFRGPDPRHVRQRNIWHLYQDLIWLGLASAVNTYINVYAIRLGASETLLGLRASIPSLMVVLLRGPAAQWMERTSDRKSLIFRSLLLGRSFYLLIFLLPWLASLPILRQVPRAELLVALVVMVGVPGILSAAGWDSFFADVVPAHERARVVSTRSMMTHLIMLSVVPLMGSLLEWIPFPLNYQIIFLLAFIGAMVSLWHVRKIKVPPRERASQTHEKGLTLGTVRAILFGSRHFSALVLGTFVYQWAVSIASPLYNIYFIEHLGASESWIGWRATLASVAAIAAYRFWPRHIEKAGDRKILLAATPMMAFFPLLTGLATSLTPHLFIILIPRAFGSAVMLARYNLLLKNSPEARRPTYLAIYAILANIAAFIAPLVGTNLVSLIGIRAVFFISAALRLTAALLYRRIPRSEPEVSPAAGTA